MGKSRLAKFQRVTALFEVGREVVLEENGPEGPVLVWVSKLNPFEQEEARKDGSVGRARATMVLNDPLSPEMAVFNQALEGRSKENVIDALVYAKQNEDYVQALDDIKTLEDWQDKLAILERGDEQLQDMERPMDDAERTMLAALNQEYMAKVTELMEKIQKGRRDELVGQTDEEVRETYQEQYRQAAASQGFLTEYKISEMYYSLRDCEATLRGEKYDHSRCANHRDRLCDSRGDIRLLPEGLIVMVNDAIRELTMTPGEAGNSGAPASSFASSEQRSEAAEASTPSTPAEMSPSPDGTS